MGLVAVVFRYDTVCSMWWIQDLFYRPAVRVVFVVLVLAGAGFGVYNAFAGSDGSQSAGQASFDVGGLAGVSDAPSAVRCNDALTELDRLVELSSNIGEMNAADREPFVAGLIAARVACSYREYVAFEASTLLPWTKNVSVQELFGDQLAETGS
jgi:hypothetical protein